MDENVAKYQARAIEQAIDIAVSTVKHDIDNKELVTKGDVRESESTLIISIGNISANFSAKSVLPVAVGPINNIAFIIST